MGVGGLLRVTSPGILPGIWRRSTVWNSELDVNWTHVRSFFRKICEGLGSPISEEKDSLLIQTHDRHFRDRY